MVVHYLQERCTGGPDRWPLVTAALVLSTVVVFYSDAAVVAYARTEQRAGAPLLYAFFHSGPLHVWSNMVIFGVAGAIVEATETSLRLALVVAVSTPIAAAFHGLTRPNGVIGASGYVFAAIAYQLCLVLKNWREMRLRPNHPNAWIQFRATLSSAPSRLAIAIVLLASEIAASTTESNTSHVAHLGGALAGAALSASMGSNVLLEKWEVIVTLLGVCAAFALVGVVLGSGQVIAAVWAWAFVLASLWVTRRELVRWSERFTVRWRVGEGVVVVARRAVASGGGGGGRGVA